MTVTSFHHDGVKFAVTDHGGDGVPFLFQHGLCGSATQTVEVIPELPDIRAITLECRGHGNSEAGNPDGFSIATFTSDVDALIDAWHLAPVIIGGISMGAAIALRLAVRRPEKVRALVLARPAWVFDRAPENMQPNAEVGHLLRAHPSDEARAMFMASPTAKRLAVEAPDNLASLTGFFERTPQEMTAALLTQISADGPGVSAAEIAAITCPVLIIGHGDDVIHPFSFCEAFAELMPSAKLVRIPAKTKGKAPYITAFKAALAEFLEDVSHGKA